MVTRYPNLHRKVVEEGIAYPEVAAIAGIRTLTLYLKLLGIKRWKLTEAVRICCFFNTQDTEHLFAKTTVCFVRDHYIIQK